MQFAATVRERLALTWRAAPGFRAASWPLPFWYSPKEHHYNSMKRERTWQSDELGASGTPNATDTAFGRGSATDARPEATRSRVRGKQAPTPREKNVSSELDKTFATFSTLSLTRTTGDMGMGEGGG
jgi:hypothetical protein